LSSKTIGEKGEGKMAKRAATVQEWFSLNQEELIHCPHQLGNLKITKSSCLKQRRKSGEWTYGIASDNYTVFSFERHLMICQQCDQMKPEEPGQDQNILRQPRTGRTPESLYRQGKQRGRNELL
jgi:hypothetical protein